MKRLLILLGTLLGVAPAHADDTIATYAIVIGSNAGGPGQAELHFAEDDARKVAGVLTDLGGYTAGTVDVIVHPTPQVVRDKLAALATRVQADVAAGRQARVFFYYSGHARADAIDLGGDQLPLPELRQRLFAVPATLTVVVLDACQSGAFSRVKGATPAADFSFSSKQRLDATGIAVLASSSGSELSQESERLRGSYFTHHFLVGLRGAGDANHDGEVSIDEAYRYAYHQTLLATAETAVGGQHVSFEVDLKGHGEVPLSFPVRATSALELPVALEGQTVVESRVAHAVIAETYKAKGAAVRIAVAPGDYSVLVRANGRVARCEVTAPATIDVARCPSEAIEIGRPKGGRGWDRATRVELDGFAGGEHADGYTQTLTNFSYRAQDVAASAGLGAIGLRRVHDYLWVGGALASTGSPQWTRAEGNMPSLEFSWSTTTVLGLAHAELPFTQSGRTAIYARAGLGLGIGRTHFVDVDGKTDDQTYFGPAATIGAGLHFDLTLIAHAGITLGYQFDYARVIDNEIGDTHASGGHRIVAGLSWSY